ncbi:MAG: hypothetical protein JWQ62_3090, partial [Lacunisphaera sp.]|nr:hypothetical protein [Lacunisphaera sp.]
VAFAKLSPGTGTDQVKANLATRPSPAVIEECFADLLRQIEFSHATPNRGYIEALGLSVPQ